MRNAFPGSENGLRCAMTEMRNGSVNLLKSFVSLTLPKF